MWPDLYVLWPMLPSCLQKDSTVFLDRLCICQFDDELCREGVYSLGGFVDKSRSMLLIWSKPYLTRKWCVFEVAACISTNSGCEHGIEFAPLYIELSCLLMFLFNWLLLATQKVSQVLGLTRYAATALACITVPVSIHRLRKETSENHMFLEALRSFDVRQSSCRESFDDQFVNAAISSVSYTHLTLPTKA